MARIRRLLARQMAMERGDFLKTISKDMRSAKGEMGRLVLEMKSEGLLPDDKPERELVKIDKDRVTYIQDYKRSEQDVDDFSAFLEANGFKMRGHIGASKRKHGNAAFTSSSANRRASTLSGSRSLTRSAEPKRYRGSALCVNSVSRTC